MDARCAQGNYGGVGRGVRSLGAGLDLETDAGIGRLWRAIPALLLRGSSGGDESETFAE